MGNKFFTAIAIVLLLGSFAHAAIVRTGTFGQTYPIVEPDALKEMENRAAQVDWRKIFNQKTYEKAMQNYHPDAQHLPRAQKNKTRIVDMTYTLPFDIPDDKGGILYPKGYTYNPLDYVKFTQTLVVINGDDPDQVKWFTHSKYADTSSVMLLLSEGAYYPIEHKLAQPVFYASTDMIQRFQLQAVPSVILQDGKYMEVEEIVVSEKNK